MNTLSVGQCITSGNSEYAISAVNLENDQLSYTVLGLNAPTRSTLQATSLHFYELSDRVISLDALRERRMVVQNAINLAAAAKVEEKAARQLANEAASNHPDNAGLLKVGQNDSSAKIAVKNIRILLKRLFPGVKFSVRMPDYSEVFVSWEDGAPQDTVYSAISRFKHGHFDSMTDCYEFHRSPFNDAFGGVSYLHVSRQKSDALIAEAIENVRREVGAERVPDSVTIEAYKRGSLLWVGEELSFRGFQGIISDAIALIDKTKK